jgi:acetylglutamate kinase
VFAGPLTVLKIGGELIESDARARQIAPAIRDLAGRGPLLIVHGGGKDIDAEATRRGLVKRAVDGLRITDAATLDAVVASLAGTVNTRLVAALVAHGVSAVGLTGVDDLCGIATVAPPHPASDGTFVDLGLVGEPPASAAPPRLILDLLAWRYVPVLACLGCTVDGTILNVNADTLASAVARQLGAAQLIVAGATPGVLDADGSTISLLDLELLAVLIADGRASAGMVAKLRACRAALIAGMDVRIVDGRTVVTFDEAAGTRLATERTVAAPLRSGNPVAAPFFQGGGPRP